MSQQAQASPPKIRKLNEIGEVPFQFIGVLETILEGWSARQRRSAYLFKMEDGRWAYYDKPTEQVLPVEQWKGKAAWVGGEWIKMTKKHRIHVNFVNQVTYSEWFNGQSVTRQTNEAQVAITDTAYQTLVEAMKGRPPNSAYRFCYKQKRKKGGGSMNYIEKVIWAEELPM